MTRSFKLSTGKILTKEELAELTPEILRMIGQDMEEKGYYGGKNVIRSVLLWIAFPSYPTRMATYNGRLWNHSIEWYRENGLSKIATSLVDALLDPLDLLYATTEDLLSRDGIGPSSLQLILDWRENNQHALLLLNEHKTADD